jgi:hypothetical protein
MDNEDQYIVGTIIVSLIVCGKKFLIFYNEFEEGKKYREKGVEEFRVWWTTGVHESLALLSVFSPTSHYNSHNSLL